MLRFILALLFSLLPALVYGSVTITNFVTTSQGTVPTIRFSTDGKALDLHDGGWVQYDADGPIYWYGTRYSCTPGAFILAVAGTACGFDVSVSNDGGKSWSPQRPLLTVDTNFKNTLSTIGTFRWHVLKHPTNPSNQRYVAWFNSSFVNNGLQVWTSANPDGPFTSTGVVPTLAGCSLANDLNLLQLPNGNAYLFYSCVSGGVNASIKVEKLSSDYLNLSGLPATTVVSGNFEGMAPFVRSNEIYLLYGPGCGYCNSTPTVYKHLTADPLGTWSSQAQINATSCGGQPTQVTPVTFNGTTQYIVQADLWTSFESPPGNTRFGFANQARSSQFWNNLTFSGTSINTFNCDATFSISATDTGATVVSNPGADPSTGFANMGHFCGASSPSATLRWSQTFTPVSSGLHTLKVVVFQGYGQNADSCGGSSGANGICITPDADLIVDVTQVDGAHKPSTLIQTFTIPRSTMSWAPELRTVGAINLTGGTEYNYTWRSTSSTNGCYGFGYNDSGGFSGFAFVSTNSGSTWSAQTGRNNLFTAQGGTVIIRIR